MSFIELLYSPKPRLIIAVLLVPLRYTSTWISRKHNTWLEPHVPCKMRCDFSSHDSFNRHIPPRIVHIIPCILSHEQFYGAVPGSTVASNDFTSAAECVFFGGRGNLECSVYGGSFSHRRTVCEFERTVNSKWLHFSPVRFYYIRCFFGSCERHRVRLLLEFSFVIRSRS